MNQAMRRLLPVIAALSLGGCNLVMTDRPMFAAADGVGAPPIRPGVWRTDKPDCVFDETLPQNQWPRCASASPSVADPPFWLQVAGDPALLQTPLPLPDGKAVKLNYLYIAYRPLKLDGDGRVVAMKSWPVRCGPPPPPETPAPDPAPSAEPPTSDQVGPPSTHRPPDGMSEADRAKLRADLARLKTASAKLSAALARVTPTKAPLPGLTMNEDTGGCAADSVRSLRNAASASEAWADEDSISHWVRVPGAGDLPAASAASLMNALGRGPIPPAPLQDPARTSGRCGGIKVPTNPDALSC